NLSEMELKKILIEKKEGNKSIQRSDEQQNLYKALVEAYDADKAILDTYEESTILKRRRKDDDQEGPSAGSDRGSKRQKEGGDHASANTPSETATEVAYRSTTGLDIMFAVYACSRFQVTPKTSHLQVVKRIFRKSTIGGCQFLSRRLISWQCKKQTIVATSTIEAEYVAIAHCYG
nr:hypothetical protein [Tanacetum cinerariifolium]